MNYLISLLSQEEKGLLRNHVEKNRAEPRHEAIQSASALDHCFLIESGIASVVLASPRGQQGGSGVVGLEGMVQVSTLTAGGQMPAEVIIQVKGSGLEIPFECFRQVFRESTDFREIPPALPAVILRATRIYSTVERNPSP